LALRCAPAIVLDSIEYREGFMLRVVSIASAFTLALLVGSQAIAQQPPPANPPSCGTPDAMPFDIPYGAAISAEKAKQILAAAEAEAKERNWKMNIAVVDTNGDLVHFLRMEGVTISQGKARTAARYRRPTQVFYNAYETGHPYVSTLDPTLVASPGGFPLVEGGKLIGAIGCSGGTGDQDALICKVGADMIK
jgi:glc operon protein GlcG